MINQKDILVTTTSTIEGLSVKQYLKPIAAHIVAGTNLFSDFLASFSDTFGGRSHTYQKQLTSLYNEAIEKLKNTAYEMGANCIIGLKVDLDEISGKGKSMFMITAIGTAAILDDTNRKKQSDILSEKFENVGVDRIKVLQRKKEIIKKAATGDLQLNEETWEFITTNQVSEVYDFIVNKFNSFGLSPDNPDTFGKYYNRTLDFLDSLPYEKKLQLLYDRIVKENDEQLALQLCSIIEDLQLLEFEYLNQILQDDEFPKQKRGLRIATYDKPFYNKEDVNKFHKLIEVIKTKFPERGIRSMKKQLLSSKEKEVWTCECKSTNDIGKYCSNCNKDIYGFKSIEITPLNAIAVIEEKINLILEYVE